MQPVEARRSERVHYNGTVEVCVAGDDAATEPVLAEALDLGTGGIGISAPLRMPVGAQVTCKLELDGHEAAIPGRVAWLAQPERGNGMGICFDPLGSHESALVQYVVDRSRAGYRPIELRFAGVPQPIRARARAHSRGLRLTAVLPILARGTELHFRLDEEGPLFTGRITDALLQEEEGGRRLDVEVEVRDSDGVRFRRHARYGYPDEIEAEEHRAATPTAIVAEPQQVTTPRPSRKFLGAGPMLFAACAGALGGWLTASLGELAPSHRPQPVNIAAPQARLTAQPTTPGAATARATVAATTPGQAPAAAPLPPAAASTSPQLAKVAPARDLASAAELPGAPQTPRLPVVAGRQPQLLVEGDITRVLLPFEGTPEQLQPTLWAAPYALALTLHQGRAALADGSYRLSDGGVTGLRVHSRDGEQLLRLMLAAPIERYSVALDDNVLELRVVHAPASAANP